MPPALVSLSMFATQATTATGRGIAVFEIENETTISRTLASPISAMPAVYSGFAILDSRTADSKACFKVIRNARGSDYDSSMCVKTKTFGNLADKDQRRPPSDVHCGRC